MRKAFEDKFLKTYQKFTPAQIFQIEGRKAIATVAFLREQGRAENNRLKAAEVLIKKAFPDTEKVELSGALKIKWEG